VIYVDVSLLILILVLIFKDGLHALKIEIDSKNMNGESII